MAGFLVTGVGGPTGRALAGELHRRGCPVVGVDSREVGGTAHPFHRVPHAGASGFTRSVFELCRLYGAEVVVPTVSDELPVLAAVRRVASRGGIAVVVGEQLPVNIACDMWLTYQCLQLMEVAVPRTLLAGDLLSVSDVEAGLGLPVLRRPRDGSVAGGVTVHRDLRTVFDGRAEDRYVWQEYLPGAGYRANLYLGADGGISGGVLREGALSVRRVSDSDVAAVALAAVRSIGLRGPVEVDIRRRVDGTPAVLEVNARFGSHCAKVPEVIDALLREHYLPGFDRGPAANRKQTLPSSSP